MHLAAPPTRGHPFWRSCISFSREQTFARFLALFCATHPLASLFSFFFRGVNVHVRLLLRITAFLFRPCVHVLAHYHFPDVLCANAYTYICGCIECLKLPCQRKRVRFRTSTGKGWRVKRGKKTKEVCHGHQRTAEQLKRVRKTKKNVHRLECLSLENRCSRSLPSPCHPRCLRTVIESRSASFFVVLHSTRHRFFTLCPPPPRDSARVRLHTSRARWRRGSVSRDRDRDRERSRVAGPRTQKVQVEMRGGGQSASRRQRKHTYPSTSVERSQAKPNEKVREG